MRQVNGKFDPLPRPNPLTDHHQPKVAYVITSQISTHMQNLVTIPRGVSFPVCTKLCIKNVYSASFFSVLPTPHSRGPRTDFQAKYIKWRGSTRARMCLFWVIKFFFTFKPHIPKIPQFLGPILTGTENFQSKTALQWGLLHVNFP